MLDIFFYLENHIDWKVKVNYYIRYLSSFCEKTGVFSLKFVNVGESITVTLADVSMELEFFGPNSFIKTLEISCQEGFFIKIYDNEKLNLEELNSLKSVFDYAESLKNDILSNNFDSLYREYFSNRCAHYERFNDLFDIDTLFSHRSRVYLFSNEPLKLMFTDKAFFSDVDLSNKSIFSIIASGDFFFNLCLLGCKNMTLVDINEYAYYYFEIKKAMIKKYNYEEFITMYKDLDNIYYKFNEYSSFIKDDIRNKIINKFSLYADNVSSFVKNISWSCSYEFNNLDNIGRRIDFFRTHNLYLSSEDNYNKLKSVLLKDDIDLNMYVSSLFDLDLDNMEKFDYIYLSNIGDYCDTSLFYEFLLNIKNKILNETGKIILVYRTDNYKYLLDKNLKITRYNASFDTSLDNVIIYCSFY